MIKSTILAHIQHVAKHVIRGTRSPLSPLAATPTPSWGERMPLHSSGGFSSTAFQIPHACRSARSVLASWQRSCSHSRRGAAGALGGGGGSSKNAGGGAGGGTTWAPDFALASSRLSAAAAAA